MPKPRTMLVLEGLALSDGAPPRPVPDSFLAVRYGRTVYTKGGERGEYEFTEADADRMLGDFSERRRDVVIDYEHQTLSGGQAPAAGWIERLEKTAEGVVAHVKYWTEEAKRHLADGAYRYFSPVLAVSRRHPLALHSVALTNHPATHAPDALVMDDDNDEENDDMDAVKKLAGLLGVAIVALADGKEDMAATLTAVETRIKELVASAAGVAEFVKLHDCADLGAVTLKVKGMVPAGDKAALEAKLAKIEAEKAVAVALTDGKLVEAQRAWAIEYAASQPQAFAAFVAAAPKVAPGPASQTGVQTSNDAKPVALTDTELTIFRNQGLSEAQIEAIKAQRKAGTK